MSLLIYLLKVIVVSAIFFGYYRFFLRNKRFHHYNRFFLLSALLLSIVLPFIRIPLLYQPENPVNHAVYTTVSVINSDYGEEVIPVETTGPINESAFTLLNSIYLLYAIGVLFLLTLVIKSLLYIQGLRKRYPAEKVTGLSFYNTHEPGTPFSFFRSIFWNDQLTFNSHEGQQIFRHELFHVQHRHSADRLLSEMVTAIFWFNPFFHLIKKELKAIHEFLADQFAVSHSDRYAYATLLVQQALDTAKHSLTNHFFQSHIKRRIAMITQFNQTNYGYWSRVMILPVSLLLFCFITLYAKKPVERPAYKMEAAANEQPLTLLVDVGHGGSDAGAIAQYGGVKEKDLTLQISRKIQELAANRNINVIMSRDGDYLAGNKLTAPEALRYTTSLIADRKPDAVVSIHIGAEVEGSASPKNGIDLYITDRNAATQQSSRVLGEMLIGSLNSVYTVNPVLRQRKTKGIYVLDQAVQPAVLIECGNLSSSKDLEFISNPANQEKIAMGILQGLINFKKAGPVTEQVTDTLPGDSKREKELREVRKKMEEREVRLREERQMELEIIRKKMQEQEIMSVELEQIRNKQRAEVEILKKEMKERQERLSTERREQLEEMKKILKDQKGNEKENEAKLKDINKKLQELEEMSETRNEEEKKVIEEKMREVEMNSEHQMRRQKERQEEMMTLKQKMKERENDLKHENNIDVQKLKQDVKQQEQEMKRQEKEKRELQKEIRKQREKEGKENRKGSSFNEQPAKWYWQNDSLLKKILRQYNRQLRYPQAAIDNGAEGAVYFSIVVEPDGEFKDFTAYGKPPSQPVQEIVIVGYNKPVVVSEKELSDVEKQDMLTKEVKRASERKVKLPVFHPEEKKYYLKAVFKLVKHEEKGNALLTVTENSFTYEHNAQFELIHTVDYQDTIPAKPASKAFPAKPAVERNAKSSPKPAPLFKDARVTEPRKSGVVRMKPVETRKAFSPKGQRLFKSPSKPSVKPKPPTKPVDGPEEQ